MKTLLVMVVALVFPGQMLACLCLDVRVQDALKWADAVFAGQATKVQYVDAKGEMLGERRIIVTFAVSGYWKGDVRQTVILHTVYDEVGYGGHFFNEGEHFIVYAKKHKAKEWLGDRSRRPKSKGIVYPKPNDDILDASLCTRTNHLVSAAEDLKDLGPPKVPK